jgi:hypothetical protein
VHKKHTHITLPLSPTEERVVVLQYNNGRNIESMTYYIRCAFLHTYTKHDSTQHNKQRNNTYIHIENTPPPRRQKYIRCIYTNACACYILRYIYTVLSKCQTLEKENTPPSTHSIKLCSLWHRNLFSFRF